MNRLIIIPALIVLVLGGLFCFKIFSDNQTNDTGKQVDTVLIVPKEYRQTFGESIKSAGSFYDVYGKGKRSMAEGNYEEAIKYFNESLPHVGIIIERDMVYSKLAKVYRLQGKLEQELKYLEAMLASIPKDAPPSDVREKNYQRVVEIRQLLATKNQASTNQT